MSAGGERRGQGPLVRVDVGKLRKMGLEELGLRFAFGAAASLLAGVVSIVFGPRAGGMFLAFPAILPASLTLIEKKEDLSEATQDVIGAILGALALVAFAVVGGGALKRFAIGVALALALVAWLAAAVGAYIVVELVRRRARRARAEPVG